MATDSRFSLVDVIAMLGNECTDQEEVLDQEETFAPGSDERWMGYLREMTQGNGMTQT